MQLVMQRANGLDMRKCVRLAILHKRDSIIFSLTLAKVNYRQCEHVLPTRLADSWCESERQSGFDAFGPSVC